MSTVDPYTTHHRGDVEPDDTALDPRSPYAYPSPFSGEQTGEPIDLHPYETGDSVLDLTEPIATLGSEPRVHRPAQDRSAQRDDESWMASTRGIGQEMSRLVHRLESPETKIFFKTSEFAVMVVASVVLMVAAAVSPRFDADQLWPLFTWLVGFYLLSRGLAKAGSRHR